ncbi:Transcriptional regulator GntR family [Agrobacterium deltaense Zutra 3/1]|uniref:Transcriptional regulator GntR family n=1 Tax=Agrobacterium deltaense Zutra 3/1 TaxID=1183427 RepID=A0A1S7R8C1_9HYPH|nr:GntR family transcriptional regulator [Agrobacterium deltaense]CUX48578.1 Transcriptional regulator GntR family [Agrobacterium deltaense Zutra 3/1]
MSDRGNTKEAGSPRRPAPEIVRDGVREDIFRGLLASGVQLRQDQLAEQYGTSRIPVREALRQLEAEGLVRIEPNRGAIVTSLSLNEVLEMLDIRIALECHALRLAIPNMAEEDLAHAESILEAYNDDPDPASWGSVNWRFHTTLYEPCQSPRLLQMIEANNGHVNRFVRVQVSLAAGKERPQQEHHALIDLCREGRVEEAVRLLKSHIEQTQKSVRASQRQRG